MSIVPDAVLTRADIHWDTRARTHRDDRAVNTPNVDQRDLELAAIEPYLTADMDVLEVGCGNGYTTAWLRARVRGVTAIDRSAEMIARAKATHGETNNLFVERDIRALRGVTFDAIVCVRVLINLASVEEQRGALEAMAGLLRPDGTLLLVEGFADGFRALNEMRAEAGMQPLDRAPFNLYTPLAELLPDIERLFAVEDTFHLGGFDYLTRVSGVEPKLAARLAGLLDEDRFERFSRIRGFILRKPA